LKIGFRYAARIQHHSSKKPNVDPGCKQVPCTNKNSRQVYIAGTTKLGGTKCKTKTCSTSTYIDKNKCVACPAWYKCDGTAKKVKLNCPKTSFIDKNKCSPCPNGYKCDGKKKNQTKLRKVYLYRQKQVLAVPQWIQMRREKKKPN
jgi:hypothetical protein